SLASLMTMFTSSSMKRSSIETASEAPSPREANAMSNSPVIEINNVIKSFGRKRVLNGETLAVQPGETFAYLGRNGAGKTTTIKMLLGLLKPDFGTVRVLGLDPAANPL